MTHPALYDMEPNGSFFIYRKGDMDSVQLAFNKAKIQLMSREDSAFFTTVFFSLKHIWDDSIPTAATDGLSIAFNPHFFMSLHPEERLFLILHETLHVAYLHMLRRGGRDPAKFNIAADHVINIQLIERKFKMPKMGLADFQYQGMSVEQVYNLLPDPPKGSNTDLDILAPAMPTEELTQAIEDILVRASVQSKIQGDAPGTIPGEIQVFLNGLLSPKLPWYRILQKYIQALAKNDYSFRKPNRRFFPQYHLPSLFGTKMIDIAIAVDISGSVTDDEFKVFISEIHCILKMLKPEKISLLQFDSVIKSVTVIRNVKELSQVQFKGRGGTKINPVLNWANENKPYLLLTFTDGCFRFTEVDTKVPTIWVINDNHRFSAPFGKVVHYDIN